MTMQSSNKHKNTLNTYLKITIFFFFVDNEIFQSIGSANLTAEFGQNKISQKAALG